MQTLVALFWFAALGQGVECHSASALLLLDDTTLACARGEVATLYVRGLVEARDATALGGSPESLRPLHATIAALEGQNPRTRQIDISVYVLQAAAAAAQSEREEMALYLAQALQMESLQLAARQPAAPVVTAHEVAGDLWLRVYRYEDARQAYLRALSQVGPTGRAQLGLARAEARLKSGPAACPDSELTCP